MLSVRGLSVRFLMPGGRRVAAVTDAHFAVVAGECLAVTGESGCGKSVLASALLGLLPANAQTAGEALLGDLDLVAAQTAAKIWDADQILPPIADENRAAQT